jgi:hypothetical protein
MLNYRSTAKIICLLLTSYFETCNELWKQIMFIKKNIFVLTGLFLDRLRQKYILWLRNFKSENKKIHSFHKHNSSLVRKGPFAGTMICASSVTTALCCSLYLHCHPELFSCFFLFVRRCRCTLEHSSIREDRKQHFAVGSHLHPALTWELQ